ncbi:extracellular solute-binding protein [Lachnospiraceae bacterium ASD3451]|uniref:ABC transporter substrate-binding protein n=1 Tax=Diplocloster agilis TaxID=2850323 RepID=UPI001D9922EF|nr:extracellular solute-binding protein [Diplocloster agilis]MBU9746416.1 extracellular solute-binding protein [Diplocloster agilis]
MGKKLLAVLLSVVMTLGMMTGCGSGTQENSGNDSESGSQQGSQTEENRKEATGKEESGKKTKVVCYVVNTATTSQEPIWNSIKEKLSDRYEIELLEVDTENLDTVIKTGIASGEPADIYFKQGQYLKPYVDAGQALDLTPYLTENNGEWLNSLDQSLVDVGKYDGKYYSVPMTGVYANFYYNADLLKEAGIEIPSEWTWDQFMETCAQIDEKTEAYPYAICGLCNDFMARNALLSKSNDAGTMEAWGNAEVAVTDPLLQECLEQTKELYDKGYWYPKDGAMITTRDEVIAAFHQGKVAIIGDVNAVSGMVAEGCDFNIGIAAWPKAGKENISLGGADAYFIPSNAQHPDAAIEILKEFTSEEMQQIHADYGFAPVNVNVTSEDPLVQQFADLKTRIYGSELMYISTEMTAFWQDVLIEDYCLETNGLDELLNQMEKLRQEAVQK